MAKIDIGGHVVEIDDGFLKLSPDEQAAEVDHIAASLPKKASIPNYVDPASGVEIPGLTVADVHPNPVEMAKGALNTASIGMGARAYALGQASAGKQSYDDALREWEAGAEKFAEEHPYLSGGSKLAGGAVSAAGAARAGLTLIPQAAKTGLGALTRAATAEGALWGGAGGAGETYTGNLKDYATNAAKGFALGGVIGATIPSAAALLGKGYNFVASHLGSAPEGVPSGPAGRLLSQALPADAPERLAKLGPAGSVVDISPRMEGLGQGVAVGQGEGSGQLVTHLRERDAGTNARLAQTLSEQLGPEQSPARVQADIAATKEAATAPDFQAGDAGTVNAGTLAERPSVAVAVRKAANAVADEGRPLPMVVRDENGNIVPSNAADTFAEGQRQRLDTALGDVLGFRGPLSKADEIRARRSAEASPYYETGHAAPIDYETEAGQALIQEHQRIAGAFPEALAYAKRLLAAEGAPGAQAEEAAARAAGPATPYGQTGSGGPTPDTLSRFIARNGGLLRDGQTADLARGIRGVGRVVREDGHSIDGYWRNRLINAGYLPRDPDGGEARDITNELFELLRREGRGERIYPEGFQPRGRARMTPEERDDLAGLRGEVVRDLVSTGVQPRAINDEIVTRAAERLAGRHAATGREAYEQAAALHGGDPAAPQTLLTARHWDYIKRGLDDVIKDNKDIGGNLNQIGLAAQRRKNALLAQLDETSPDLKTARSIWADESGGLDALEKGRKAYSANYTREQVQRDLAELGDTDREHYRLGFGAAARENMANSPRPASKLENKAFQDKLALMAEPEALARYNAAMQAEDKAFTQAQEPTAHAWRRAYQFLKEKADKATGEEATHLAQARDDLREALSQNPDFRRGLFKAEHYDRVSKAVDEGQAMFGPTVPHAEDLAASYLAKTPAERAAMFKGARSAAERAVRTQSNDLVALKKTFGGSGDWSRDNANTVFGPEATEGVLAGIAREQRMRDTLQRVDGGSQTPQRTAGKELIDRSSGNVPVDMTVFGSAAHAAQAIMRFAFKGLAKMSSDATRTELARIMTLPEAERDRVVDAILSAANIRGAQAAIIRQRITQQVGLIANNRAEPADPRARSAKR